VNGRALRRCLVHSTALACALGLATPHAHAQRKTCQWNTVKTYSQDILVRAEVTPLGGKKRTLDFPRPTSFSQGMCGIYAAAMATKVMLAARAKGAPRKLSGDLGLTEAGKKHLLPIRDREGTLVTKDILGKESTDGVAPEKKWDWVDVQLLRYFGKRMIFPTPHMSNRQKALILTAYIKLGFVPETKAMGRITPHPERSRWIKQRGSLTKIVDELYRNRIGYNATVPILEAVEARRKKGPFYLAPIDDVGPTMHYFNDRIDTAGLGLLARASALFQAGSYAPQSAPCEQLYRNAEELTKEGACGKFTGRQKVKMDWLPDPLSFGLLSVNAMPYLKLDGKVAHRFEDVVFSHIVLPEAEERSSAVDANPLTLKMGLDGGGIWVIGIQPYNVQVAESTGALKECAKVCKEPENPNADPMLVNPYRCLQGTPLGLGHALVVYGYEAKGEEPTKLLVADPNGCRYRLEFRGDLHIKHRWGGDFQFECGDKEFSGLYAYSIPEEDEANLEGCTSYHKRKFMFIEAAAYLRVPGAKNDTTFTCTSAP
jgi:hypothetical protein